MDEKNKTKKTQKNRKQKTNKKILSGCTTCLFTMRQEDQSFNKALL